MILIRLTPTQWVAADQIESIVISGSVIRVTIKRGTVHFMDCAENTTLEETAKRLADMVNHSVTTMHGPKVEHIPKFRPHDQD